MDWNYKLALDLVVHHDKFWRAMDFAEWGISHDELAGPYLHWPSGPSERYLVPHY